MNEKKTTFREEPLLETEEYSWNQGFSNRFTENDEDAGSWWIDEK